MTGLKMQRINGVREITTGGMFVALALIFSYLERFVPLGALIPVPGIKLGLANIVTIVVLFHMGIKAAVLITVLRCVLANVLFGTMISMAFALSGAVLALLTMAALKTGYDNRFSIIGISAGGAAAHNTGQVVAASFLMKSSAVIAYLPMLLIASIFTGFVTGVIAQGFLKYVSTFIPKRG